MWCSSSHLNHRFRPGRLTRICAGQVFSTACQRESRQTAALHAIRSGFILSTWPAQHHLLFNCSCCQKRMPASFADANARRVDRFTQSTHGSSGLRRGPAIRLSIAFWIDFKSRFSFCVRSHDSLHQRAVCITQESNIRNLLRRLPSLLRSRGKKE